MTDLKTIECNNVYLVEHLKNILEDIGGLKLHPTSSEEYDAGYIAARNDAFAILQEVIDNVE